MLNEALSQPVALSPEILCRTVFLLHRHAYSGQLIIRQERLSHTLCWIDGRLVAYQSSFPDFEWRKLIASNPMSLLLPDGIDSPQAVLNQGYVSRDQWQRHLDYCLEQALIWPLTWHSGTLEFIEQKIDGRTVDPHLLQKIAVLPVLFRGVTSLISGGVCQDIDDSCMLVSAEPLTRWLFAFQVPNKWSRLAQLLVKRTTLSSITSQFDDANDMHAFVWLLQACKLIKVYAVKPTAFPDQIPLYAETMSLNARPVNDELPDTTIQNEYRKRMGQDYYAFLGLPGTVSSALLFQRVRQLMHQWSALWADVGTQAQSNPSVINQINSLALNLYDIWAVLLSTESKANYDQLRRDGLAPIAGKVCRSQSLSMESISDIRAMVSAGAYAKAYPLLDQLAAQHFQYPEVLALLGWVRFNLGADELGLVMIEAALMLEECAETLSIADQYLSVRKLSPQHGQSLLCLALRKSVLNQQTVAPQKPVISQSFRIGGT